MVSEPESVAIITGEERDQEPEEEERDMEEVEETWYGWLVVAASFLCNMVIDGMGYSFGVMLQPLMYEFHVGAGEISFVGSILNGVYLLSAPLAAACINRFGSRITCITGSLVSAVSIFASSYSTSLTMLLITYGVLGGLGLGLMYTPAVVTVGQYFSRRLNLATGISVCGSGAGTFAFAPIASGLISSYGWRGSNRVMAAFCLLCSLLGLVMAPNTRWQVRDREDKPRKLIDLTILRDVPFLLYIISNIPTVMSVYCLYYYLPPLGESRGLSSDQASYLISVIGITNTLGRVLSGWVSDIPSVSPLVVNLLALLSSIVFPVLLTLRHNTYSAFLAVSAVMGLSIAPLPTVTSGVITNILGADKLNDAFGLLTFLRGVSAFLGPPIAGYLADYRGDFTVPYILAAGLFGASAVIISGSLIVYKRRQRIRNEYQEF